MNGGRGLELQRSKAVFKGDNIEDYSEHDGWDALESIATVTSYGLHREISSGDETGFWYRVVTGAAKRCATQPDGRRQIVNLLLPGDFFGLVAADESDLTVEALIDGTQIARYPRRRIEALADIDPEVSRLVREIAFRAISRLEGQLLIVGRVTALEKVAAFLLEMGERFPMETTDRISLPISRSDIGEFLAISAETVSRSLSGLKQRGLIRFSGTRQVRIVDREAIEDGRRTCRTSRQ